MSSRSQRDKNQKQNANNQVILTELLKEEANRNCSDCQSKGPRWASWNLGVFLCIRCAGIHRNLGVHISRVKSVNLDSWTPEQMNSVQQWGNKRAQDYWEYYLPDDFRRPQTDGAVETFIRNKYERKQYAKKDGLPPVSEPREVKTEAKPKKKKDKKDENSTTASPVTLRSQAEKTKPVAAPATSSVTIHKPIQRPAVQAAPVPRKPGPSVDLLSLDTPVVASSASVQNHVPVQPAQAQSQCTSLGAELIDFGGFQGHSNATFTQPEEQNANVSSEAKSMTEDSLLKESKSAKDSIMALYQPTSQAKPMYGVPGGMYIAPQPQKQQQQQQQASPAFNNVMKPGTFQPQGGAPVGIPQVPQQYYVQQQQQQQQQVAQIQQQLHQLRYNQQMQGQQPSMFGSQSVLNSQQPAPSAGNWMPQQAPQSFPQQQQQQQYVTTGPTNNKMYPMGTGQKSGHTLSTQLWK